MDKLGSDVSASSPSLKDKHLQLSAVIKGLHRQLRRAYRESNGDHASVWENHIQNSAGLEEYAQAMHCLATQHWGAHPDTRIEWCRQVALEYFTGGGMYLAIQKDLRKRMRQMSSKLAGDTRGPDKTSTETKSLSKVEELKIHTPREEHTHPNVKEENLEEGIRDLEDRRRGRIRLLDVGSCYNPFQECPEFDALGIDLIPATESVYQCDFLKLEVSPSVPHHPSLRDPDRDPESTPLSEAPFNIDPVRLATRLPHHPSPRAPDPGSTPLCDIDLASRQVTHLPRGSFQVVVFSLLLEYLPAVEQRWACCVKAHSLLELQGLLLIVTPDSNSAYRNAPMMKSWRQALEHLGFQRWRYTKMAHVHCMAYRKMTDELAEKFPDEVEDLLYIPQDFNNACYGDDHLPPSERGLHRDKEDDPERQAELETFLLSSVGELPSMVSDEEEEDES